MARYGIPDIVVSNNGSQFSLVQFKAFMTVGWLVGYSEMNITGTLPQAGNLKLFVLSLSTHGSTRPKQNIFNVVLM